MDDTDFEGQPDAAVIADLVKNHIKPEIVTVKGQDGQPETQVLILPEGLRAQPVKPFLDDYRIRPERREGTAIMTTLASFIDHAKRFADNHSALFANNDRAAPSLTAMLDYNETGHAGAPRFGKHRTHYKFPLSDEWKIWSAKNRTAMSQADFAEFIEDRLADIAAPPDAVNAPLDDADVKNFAELLGGNFAGPSKLVELSRGLAVHANEKVHNTVRLDSGETQVQYVSEHKDAGGGPIKVPNMFIIAVPVFNSGAIYRIAVRLRYRLKDGAVVWFYELYRPDRVFDHAFNQGCKLAATETGLPLFVGQPEQKPA